MKKNKKKIIIISVSIILVIGICITLLLFFFNKGNDKSVDGESIAIETIDAEAYFNENGNIIAVIDANSSEDVMMEKEVYKEFAERGFGELTITTNYLMSGDLIDEPLEVDGTSSEKHPSYLGQYINTSGEYWSILVYNGSIIAYPLSYNLQEDIEVAIATSESNTIMSYDCITNKFYETVPDDKTLKVIQIEKIDATALDELTVKELNKK